MNQGTIGPAKELADVTDVYPSPDGQWVILCPTADGSAFTNGLIAASIDGKHILRPKGVDVSWSWLIRAADSRSFAAFPRIYNGPIDGESGDLRRLDNPDRQESVPFNMFRSSEYGTILNNTRVAIVGTDIIFHFPEVPKDTVELFETSPGLSHDQILRKSVRLPHRAFVARVAFSPTCDRIAWELVRAPIDAYPDWMRRLLIKLGYGTVRAESCG